MTEITYSLQSGAYTPGLVGEEIDGKFWIHGVVQGADAPEWATPAGSLGEFGERASVSIPLNAALPGSVFDVVDGWLPWGLTLDRQNGLIYGVTADIKDPDAPVVYPFTDGPELLGVPDLGEFAIGDDVSITMAFNVAVGRTLDLSYIAENLPWGLTYDMRTETLSGTISDQNAPGETMFSIYARDSAGVHSTTVLTMTIAAISTG